MHFTGREVVTAVAHVLSEAALQLRLTVTAPFVDLLRSHVEPLLLLALANDFFEDEVVAADIAIFRQHFKGHVNLCSVAKLHRLSFLCETLEHRSCNLFLYVEPLFVQNDG